MTVRALRGESSTELAPSGDVLNFSWRYHPTAARCLGKTMFLFSACAAGMVMDRGRTSAPAEPADARIMSTTGVPRIKWFGFSVDPSPSTDLKR